MFKLCEKMRMAMGIVLCLFSAVFAYSGGSGTAGDPYLIATAADVNDLSITLADWVSGKYFKMTNDINLPTDVNYITPIGNLTNKFCGTFDGNDHVIRNVRINMPTSGYIGLFGYMDSGGQIRNMGVEDVNITGGNYTGGLVGENYNGTIIGCYVTGVVAVGSNYGYVGGLVGINHEDGNITDCYATGEVIGGTVVTGGLVGDNFGIITVCYSTGVITGADWVGGLVGDNGADGAHGTITNCYATGAVNSTGSYCGGLVGYNYAGSSIATCYATGTVTATGKYSAEFGGLVGLSGGVITSCYATGSVVGNDKVGGLVGNIQGAGNIINASYSYSTGTVGGNSNVGGMVGYCTGRSIISSCYSTGAVSGSSYIGGLMGYKSYCNISNCYSTGSVSGSSYVGGLVGYNRKYDNYGDVTNCYSTGFVSGFSYVGGLVGYKYSGNVTNSVWDVNTSNQTVSAGGTGKTTVEMKMLATFTSIGWDFTTPVWKICDGTGYPKLDWQASLVGDFGCPDGVDFKDLDYFVYRWLMTNCGANDDCDGADMEIDGTVNFLDFAIFAENWLE